MEKRQITAVITPDLHRKLKVLAAQSDLSSIGASIALIHRVFELCELEEIHGKAESTFTQNFERALSEVRNG